MPGIDPTSARTSERILQLQNQLRAQGTRPSDGQGGGTQGSGQVGGPATLELSGTARALTLARSVANATPDVRADRVASLAAQIEAGTYDVSSETIAEAMLRS